TDPSTIDPFFESNNFRGAFAPVGYTDDFTGRWDLGWANYTPQSTPYGVDVTISNTITLIGTLGTRSAVFGRAPGATDGIDTLLGEVPIPPLPPPGEIDVRWELSGTNDETILDYRSDDNTSVSNPITHILRLQFGSGAAGSQILLWDSDNLTGGSYTLKDGLGGIVFADVDMRTQNQLAITNLSLTFVVIEVDYNFSGAVTVDEGWNLVGAMGDYPTGNDISNWWPGRDPTVSLFKYNTPCDGTSGYSVITTMTIGEGAWMKNSTAQIYNSGDEWTDLWYAVKYPIDLCSGWNLISGLDYVAKVDELATVPNNLIAGSVYGYAGSYHIALTIDPGKGYWIKSLADGQLIIPGPFTGAPPKLAIIEENWGKITLTDYTGKSFKLYSASGELNLDDYELPPPPPAGVFDVRFGSQRFVEDLSSGNNTIDFTGVEYPVKIKVEGISLKLQDVSGKIINLELHTDEEVLIVDNLINRLIVHSNGSIPTKYSLEQNYPNPFNSNTIIKYGVTERTFVELRIYDILGREVELLVNEEQNEGYYELTYNASQLASGIYFYSLSAGSFSETKKMILLR
ncbi:MAG: T9SS type A sorting domain-containing protein, partial [Ignavibacteriaceae bacterium]|nr:T9SS type A sorting domain-containing protein [Ignavibacteriaceae bacterium]